MAAALALVAGLLVTATVTVGVALGSAVAAAGLWRRGSSTVGASCIDANTTRVHRSGIKLALLLHGNAANFYHAAPANYYAEFRHKNAIKGKRYGFQYDDDAGQTSDTSVANPQYMIVAVGW